MKVLNFIRRVESAKEFFDCNYDSKFLIFDISHLKEIDLVELVRSLSDRRLHETEFCKYVASEGFRTIDSDSNVNQIFKHSIGVVALECDLDDITLFETEEDFDRYINAYQSSYLEDSIAFEITSEMIGKFLEQNRLKRIRFLKESIDYYKNEINSMTKELAELEKITKM